MLGLSGFELRSVSQAAVRARAVNSNAERCRAAILRRSDGMPFLLFGRLCRFVQSLIVQGALL